MALMFLFVSCATRGEIKRFKLQLDYLEQTNADIQRRLARLDSLETEQLRQISALSAISDANMRAVQDELVLVRNALQESGYRAEQLTKKIETVSAELARPRHYESDSLDSTVSSREPGEMAYRQAFMEQARGDYRAAIEKYLEFIEKYPQSPFIDDAYYQVAECYYTVGQYSDALKFYLKLVELFPESSYIPAALYKSGLSYKEMGKIVSARNMFNRLIKEYPASNEAKLAKERLKTIRGR